MSTCSTCQRILNTLNLPIEVELIDIKTNPIDEQTLDWLEHKTKSYEALFSKRALKFRELGLHLQTLSEHDYKKYLLQDYTFLKRPVLIFDENIWIGNAAKTVQDAVDFLQSKK